MLSRLKSVSSYHVPHLRSVRMNTVNAWPLGVTFVL